MFHLNYENAILSQLDDGQSRKLGSLRVFCRVNAVIVHKLLLSAHGPGMTPDGTSRIHRGFFCNHNNSEGSGARISEVAMKTPLLIVLAVVVLGAGCTLAVLNNAL